MNVTNLDLHILCWLKKKPQAWRMKPISKPLGDHIGSLCTCTFMMDWVIVQSP